MDQRSAGETDPLRGLRRAGADGSDALVADDIPSRILPPGQMSFKDLAPKGPENSGEPLSTIVKDVTLRGNGT